MRRTAVMTAVVLMTGSAAFAQDEAARKAATEVAARVPFEKAMKGAPYSAETVVEGTQALADGNRIHRKTTGRVYRDGEGRTRREEDRPDGSASISIVDPVAGFSYSLDAKNKIAWRTATGATNAIMGKLEAAQTERMRQVEPLRTTQPDGSVRVENRVTAVPMTAEAKERMETTMAAARAGGGGAEPVARSVGGRGGAMIARTPDGPLEHKMLDGVPVEGRRSTSVIPAGQVGNEQPMTIVSEEWRSPDLNLLVFTRHSDPRTGESIYRLTNIIRAEPDPSLFIVPADYTVKDTGIRKMLEASQRK